MQHIKKWAQKFSDALSGEGFLNGLFSLFKNQVVFPASLAINGAGNAAAKTTNAAWVLVNGQLVKIAAATAMPALTGVSIPNGSKQIVGFTTDVGGNLSLIVGAVSTVVGGLSFAPVPQGNVALGYLIIENGTGSTFTGGTTALDTGSLTVTYVNQTNGIEPLNII